MEIQIWSAYRECLGIQINLKSRLGIHFPSRTEFKIKKISKLKLKQLIWLLCSNDFVYIAVVHCNAIVCWSEHVVRPNKYSRYDIDDTYYWCQALYYIAIQSSD